MAEELTHIAPHDEPMIIYGFHANQETINNSNKNFIGVYEALNEKGHAIKVLGLPVTWMNNNISDFLGHESLMIHPYQESEFIKDLKEHTKLEELPVETGFFVV